MDVRVLHEGQASDLVDLIATLFPDPAVQPPATERSARHFFEDPSAFALGAYFGDEPVGIAWGNQMRSPTGRLTTYLHQLEVREGFRRRGIGRALVEQAMKLGGSRGSTRFWLSTGGHNEGAQALYDSMGGDRKPLGDVNYWWQLDR